MLFGTNVFEIGKENPDLISVQIQPERFILVERNVTSSMFGIPYEFADEIINNVSLSNDLTCFTDYLVQSLEP